MFEGRSVQGVESRQFGGINELSNFVNLKQGFALDMLDFEVDPTLAIRRRDGYSVLATLGSRIYYAGSYFTADNIQIFVAVCDNKFYEALDPAGPWVDRTGTVAISGVDGPWVGDSIGGKFVLANGVDMPVVHTHGQNIQTIKDASRIAPPVGLSAVAIGTPSIPHYYCITAITARGATNVDFSYSGYAGGSVGVTGANTLSASEYNILTWTLRAGAQGYQIFKWNGTNYAYLGSVGALTNTYSDTGQTLGADAPPTINTAYNTPTAWDKTPPAGFVAVSRGRAQRLLAYGDSYIWASALSDALNWLQPNDAFDRPVFGGKDNRIVAGATLYDYTVICSRANTFVYSGSTYQDFNLEKILNVGCASPHSMVTAGDQLYFWSEVGPNSFSRVMSGQDIQTSPDINGAVQNTVSALSNRASWGKVVAWNHLRNNRIGWAYPLGSSVQNNRAILYAYSGRNDWSRHSIPPIVNTFTDELRVVYAATEDGRIIQLYSGNTDAGTTIEGFYETGWYDSQSFLNRQIVFLDVITDKTVGTYSLDVEVLFDFADSGHTHHLTESLTDDIPVVIQTPLANIHRLYVRGIGRYFKFRFHTVNSPNPPRVMGWRPEMYSKGIR